MKIQSFFLASFLIGGIYSIPAFSKDDTSAQNVNKMTSDWPARPKLAVQEMMAKYGEPLEVSTETVIWHNQGPYKRIMVTKTEIPHDFPKPHMDFLEHTIIYNVPTEKVSDLVAFDASMTINRTAGEMSARCDLEGHNILTLNLAKDIITGKKTVAQARKDFGTNVVDDVLGKHPTYVEKLTFEPHTMAKAAFPDKPIIPGSPIRKETGDVKAMGDAEVLAFVIAVDDNEVLAAAEAQKKEISKEVKDYAKMIHTEHGKNQKTVMGLGQKIKSTPTDTKAVDELRVKGAQELSQLVPLDGKEFEKAYMDAMVKGHQDVIAMIDGQLIPATKNSELKKQLMDTREHVSMHLEKAKEIQTNL
jgi:predicted outer membrane protein